MFDYNFGKSEPIYIVLYNFNREEILHSTVVILVT